MSVNSRHDKEASRLFSVRRTPRWLPLLERLSRWSDRWATVAEPPFPGCLFARLDRSEYNAASHAQGVTDLVGCNAAPAPMPPAQIKALRCAPERRLRYDPHPLLEAGGEVLVRRGPFNGRRGVLPERTGDCPVLPSTLVIGRSIALGLAQEDVVAS